MTMQIAESERGHRRGVVLGFTMAELLLLLLFCLLLVSAVAMIEKNKQIEDLKTQIDVANADMSEIEIKQKAFQLDLLLKVLFPAGAPALQPADFSKLWETLVLARNQSIALNTAGLETTGEFEQILTVWKELKAQAASSADVSRLIDALNKLVEAGTANLTEAQLANLVDIVSTQGDANAVEPGNRWPPIISLDGNKFRFRTGSAEITPEFYDYLALDAAREIADLLARYDADVIEIVGHTDEQVIEPNVQKSSNLDKMGIKVANGAAEVELIPVDNAGLGLARAIEVARVLRLQPELSGMKIVPLSAGQLMRRGDLLSDGVGTVNDVDRRRIEIRVRRSTPETN